VLAEQARFALLRMTIQGKGVGIRAAEAARFYSGWRPYGTRNLDGDPHPGLPSWALLSRPSGAGACMKGEVFV
jgi:hypothetical protein